MQHTATCACGSAAMTVSGAPVAHAVCHCNNCKKRTGSAFGVSAYFPKKSVIGTEGQLTRYALHNPHRKEDQERFFCSKMRYDAVLVQLDLSGVRRHRRRLLRG
jgi:hypothetical protein